MSPLSVCRWGCFRGPVADPAANDDQTSTCTCLGFEISKKVRGVLS